MWAFNGFAEYLWGALRFIIVLVTWKWWKSRLLAEGVDCPGTCQNRETNLNSGDVGRVQPRTHSGVPEMSEQCELGPPSLSGAGN